MTNIDKIVKTIQSCNNNLQLRSCFNWIKDLHNKKIISKTEKFLLLKKIACHPIKEFIKDE